MDTLEADQIRASDFGDDFTQRAIVIPFATIEKIIDHTEQILRITDPHTRFFTILKLTGFSVKEIAYNTSYAQRTVINWYHKYNNITAKNMIQVAHKLGLPIELFVNGLALGQGPTTLVNPINMASTEFIMGHRIFRERIAMLKEYTNTSDIDLRRVGFDFLYLSKRDYIYRLPNLSKLGALSKLFNVPMSFLIKGVEIQMPLDL